MIYLLTLFALFAFPQDNQKTTKPERKSPTAESIIAKHIDAIGGEETLGTIENYSMKGEVFSGKESVGTFEIFQATNRSLAIESFPDGTSRSHGTNGKIAWRIDTAGAPTILDGQKARDYIRHNKPLHQSLEWSNEFSAIVYVGEKSIDKTGVHHLIFVAADNSQINRYFLAESGLLVREEQIIEGDQKKQILISEIRNYVREENGKLVSRSRLNHFGSDYSIEYRITNLETNTISDDKIFDIPKSVVELQTQAAN
ncbi:MAG: hypothetical protein AB8B55_10270 [Mariniblastus sp.]